MPRFPEQFVQQVAQSTDIVELISAYIALKRKGSEFAGLCPFHDDKNPSMMVSPAKQLFKCFACGAGGGVYQWMTMYDKLSFPEAVRALAERSNIPLPTESAGPVDTPGPSKRDLIAACEFASRFFQNQLRQPNGKEALDYIQSRQMTDESLQTFGVGFAPASWDALTQAARRKGLSESVLMDAGLVARRETGGVYDRFRNRLILPICDVSGNVIGFGGRALADDQPAKYLNSPDTPLFDKSRNLYALNWARQQIVNRNRAVVVEGYFDALMPHQAGLGYVVATLGTALTESHVRMLSRYTDDVVLVFDADEAGAKAAQRGLELFLQQRINVRVATIPDGKDPCDYVLSHGLEAMEQLVDQAPDALTYVWNQSFAAIAAAGSLVQRQQQVDEFLRLVAHSEAYGAIDEVRRGQLAQHIGHLLNIPPTDLQGKLRQLRRRVRTHSGARPTAKVTLTKGPTVLAERHILEVLLNSPDLFDSAAERTDPDEFAEPTLQRIARQVWKMGMDGHLSIEQLLACEELADLGGLLAQLADSGQQRGNLEKTLAGAVECILFRRDRQEIEELKATATGDDDKLRQLQSRLNRADLRKRPRIL